MSENQRNFSDLTIIIPTLNEEQTIGLLLEKLEKDVPQSTVIVSDDGSKDKTKETVENHKGSIQTKFLDRSTKEIHGLTISVLDAIESCDTEFFVVMDGDLQHPSEVVPKFHKVLREGYDLAAGKRIEVIGKWPLHRKIMSYGAIMLGRFSLILRGRNRVKDVMSGLYASRTEIWKKVIKEKKGRFALEGYKVLFDFLRIYKTKLKITHVDYVFGTRDYGESKISKKVLWVYFKSLFK